MTRRRILKSHVSTFALVLITGVIEASLPADAACTPAAPANGATVDCPAGNTAAFVAPAGVTGLTVNVDTGATITGVTQTVNAANAQYSSIQVNDESAVNVAKGATILPTVLVNKPRDYVGVSLNGSDTTLVNNGAISVNNNLSVAGSTAYRLYGVISSSASAADFDNVQVTNNGTIAVMQSANAVARGVYSGENIDMFTLDNYGTISATRVGNATSTQAVAAVDSDDDTDTLVVNNHTGATMTATGGNTYTVGGRASDYTLQNDGTITNTGGKAAVLIYGGDDDDGTSATATIDNSAKGIINGNVSITDTSPFGATLPTMTDQTRDSAISNEGLINGSFVYGAGTHTLDNSGTITGSLTVNQNVGAGVTGVGGASFTLTNEGMLGAPPATLR